MKITESAMCWLLKKKKNSMSIIDFKTDPVISLGISIYIYIYFFFSNKEKIVIFGPMPIIKRTLHTLVAQ